MLGQIEAEMWQWGKSDRAVKKRVQLRPPYLFLRQGWWKPLFWIAKKQELDVRVICQLKWKPTRLVLIIWGNDVVLFKINQVSNKRKCDLQLKEYINYDIVTISNLWIVIRFVSS